MNTTLMSLVCVKVLIEGYDGQMKRRGDLLALHYDGDLFSMRAATCLPGEGCVEEGAKYNDSPSFIL